MSERSCHQQFDPEGPTRPSCLPHAASERWLILRYANVTDVGERSVWHCKLNPLSQLWYGSAFQRGLSGGKHTPAVSHMQWETAEISNTLLHYPTYVTFWWSLTHQPQICHCSWGSAAATDVVRCYFHILVPWETNTVLSSSSEAENRLNCFISLSGLAHVQGRTYYRSTSNKQPDPAEISSRFIYLKRNLLTTAETTSKSPASR